MAVKNLIFDVGGVLFDYRWKYMLMDYGVSEKEALRLGDEMFNDPDRLWHIFDLGTKTQEEIIEAYEKKYPADAKVIRWFISHGEYMHVPRPDVWEKIHALKGLGYGIYILSNYPEELFKKHTEYCDVMKDLDGMMVSYMIRQAKPDSGIYIALMERYGLSAGECLFFDDREENVNGALAVGMHAERVTGRKMLADRLEEIITSTAP